MVNVNNIPAIRAQVQQATHAAIWSGAVYQVVGFTSFGILSWGIDGTCSIY